MKYRLYGNTGFNISRLGYGVMRLPTDDNNDVDMDQAVTVLRHAFDSGINIFDSHHLYHKGQSEEAVGRALSDVRDKIFIQTKNHFYRPETDGDTYRDRLETALKRLRTDYLDGYMAHSVSKDSWAEQGETFLKAAAKFRDEGLVRFVGFSSHDEPDFINELIDTGAFDFVLFQYSILDRAAEPCFARARRRGMATGVMGPLGGGRIGPPVPEIAAMLPNGLASTIELALRFVLSNDNIDVAFSGMTKPDWIDQNVQLVNNFRPLGPADQKHLEAAVSEKKKLADLYCTECNYCMPCPHGVNIPRNFALMNMYRLYGAVQWSTERYTWMGTQGEKNLRASACTECGECEAKCPQNIPIIKQLKEVDKTLGRKT